MDYLTNGKPLSCKLPRKKEAINALLSLLWKKQKKDRPSWIIKELGSF